MAFDLNALFDDPRFAESIALFGATGQHNAGLIDAAKTMQHMKQLKAQQAHQQQKLLLEQQEHESMKGYRTGQLEVQRATAEKYGEQTKEIARKNALEEKRQQTIDEWVKQRQAARIGGVAPMTAPMSAPSMQLSTQAPVPSMFNLADGFVAKIEGGYVANDAGKGPTNFGVNQTANPDVNVKALTPEAASQVRKSRYWDAINGDSLPPGTAMVAYDAAINQGQDYAKRLIEQTGGNPELMLFQREKDYAALAKNPQHAPHLKGWLSRTAQLRAQLKGLPQQPATAQADPFAQYRADAEDAGMLRAMMGDVGGIKDVAEAGKPQVAGGAIFGPGGTTYTPDHQLQQDKFVHEKRKDAADYGVGGFKDRQVGAAEAQAKAAQDRADADKADAERKKVEADRARAEKVATDRKAIGAIHINTDLLNSKADTLSAHPGLERIFGIQGALPDFPGSDAANARQLQKSVIAQQAKETLAAIRDASKTGGALGNVSDKDIELLEKAIVSLDSAQSPSAAREALKAVKEHSNRLRNLSATAYEQMYGESPFDKDLPVGARPMGQKSKRGLPLFKAPNGKTYEVE